MNEDTLLIIAGTLVALGAGVFFTFLIGICGALRRLKDAEYIKTMQLINRVIENPVFGLTLIGPVVLLPILTVKANNAADDTRFMLLLAASALYIVGTIFLSLVGNVPLNKKLAQLDLTKASNKEISATRKTVELPWAAWNAVRTVAAIAATTLLFMAALS